MNQKKDWLSGKLTILSLDGGGGKKDTSIRKSSLPHPTLHGVPKDSIPSGNFQGLRIQSLFSLSKLSILTWLKIQCHVFKLSH